LDVGDAMSVEAWFKRSSTGTADTILEKGSGAYKLALTTANRVRFRRSAVADIVDSTITITDTNTWHHVVATKNGATVKLYIDGVDRTGTVTNSTLANSSDPVTIGNNSTTEYFDGYLDDVAVYNTALSAARVKAHYRAGQPYAGEVVDDSPVSYWRLGETSGTTAVDRMATSNGTYTNGPTLGQSGAPTGDPDTAVSFDGTNDYVSVPDSASLDRGNGPLSIEAWVKRSVAGANHTIVDKGTNAYKLFIGSDNLLTLRKAGSNNIVKSTTTITDTNWHHVVVTKTGATSKVYIDGADVTGTVTDQTLANTASPLGIGSISGGTTEWFNGSLDEVAVYGVVLTADQVREHYYRAP
jgi:hypothetical protein